MIDGEGEAASLSLTSNGTNTMSSTTVSGTEVGSFTSTTVNSTTLDDMMMMQSTSTTDSTDVLTETEERSVSSSTSDVGGDITVALTGSSIGASVSANSGAGDIDFDAMDSSISVGEGSGSVTLTSAGTDTASMTDTTFDRTTTTTIASATDAEGETTTTTTVDFEGETTSVGMSSTTNVGGDIAADFAESSVDGPVTLTSGSGDITVNSVDSAFGTDGGTAIRVNALATDSVTNTSGSTMDVTRTVNGATTVLRDMDVSNSTTTQTAVGGTVTLNFDADTTFGAMGEDGSFSGGDIDVDSDQDIIFNNVGRIGGDVDLRTQRDITSLATNNSTTDLVFVPATADAASVTTSTVSTLTQTTIDTVGGMVDFDNSGIIGDPQLFGYAGVDFLNTLTGIILDDINAQSFGNSSDSTTTFESTTVTPGALPDPMVAPSDGTFVSSLVETFVSMDDGADVNFVNLGSIGALGITGNANDFGVNFANDGAVSFANTRADVQIDAHGAVTIEQAGIINGNLFADSEGSTFELMRTTTVDEVSADANALDAGGDPAPGPVTRTTVVSEMTTTTANTGGVIATVTGLISDDANGGFFDIDARTGDASVLVDGGRIESELDVSAGGQFFGSTALDSTATTVDGVEVAFNSVSSFVNDTVIGDSNVALVDATISDVDPETGDPIFGSADVFVRATGNSVLGVDADSLVSDDVFVSTGAFTTSGSTETIRAFDLATGVGTGTTTVTQADVLVGGDATATVAGTVLGFTDVFAQAGDALLTLTGRSDEGFSVFAGANQGTMFMSETTFEDDAPGGPGGFTDADRVTLVSSDVNNWIGGTATALIDTADDLVADNIAAVSTGSISVQGIAGSSLTITEGTSVFPQGGSANSITVGLVRMDVTTTTDSNFPDGTRTVAQTMTPVGGDADMLNDGLIGQPTSTFRTDNSRVGITMESIGAGTFTNNGAAYADFTFNGLSAISVTDTVSTGILDPLLGNAVITETFTPVGGTLDFTNNGIFSGNATAEAQSGVLTNNGSLRGGFIVGGEIQNHTDVTTNTALNQDGSSVVTAVGPDFVQNYTINQNALLAGLVDGSAVTINDAGMVELDGVDTLLGTVQATVNLNNGSVTTGDIVGEFDLETGERFTETIVNLNGAGFLGLRDGGPITQPSPSGSGANFDAPTEEVLPFLAPFGVIDPTLGAQLLAVQDGLANLFPLTGGVVVQGVDEINKNDAGTFVVFGASGSVSPAIAGTPLTGTPGTTNFTFDTGVVNVNGGLLELDVTGASSPANNLAFDETLDPSEGTFAVRGDIVNNAGLTLGRTVAIDPELFLDNIVGQSDQIFRGIQGFQEGNFTQTDTGTLNISVAPDLVRAGDVTVGGGFSPEIFGFAGSGVNRPFFTTIERVGLPIDEGALRNSYWVIDGDLDLGGTINLGTLTNSLFVGGSTTDIFRVRGTATVTAGVADSLNSRFVNFGLGTRTEGTDTVVFLQTNRTAYATAASDPNAAAAAAGLDRALPSVVSRIQTDAAGGAGFFSVEEFTFAQDLATVFAALDTQMTDAQVQQAFTELSSAEVYGSLAAVRTTDPFGTWTRSAPARQGTGSFFLWGNLQANFEEYDFNEDFGSAGLDADLYGGSAGLGFATSSDILFGIGAGYSQVDAEDDITLDETDGDTYTVGAWVNGPIGPVNFGLQAVFGWTNWDSQRTLPLFARTATASFDSTEFRANARVGYDYALSDVFYATPYVAAEIRTYDFEGFVEEGAGGIGLAVEQLDDSVFSPEIGVDFTGELETGLATLLPRLTLSYIFQGDLETARDVTYLGDQNGSFTLVGVNPENFFQISGGLEAKIGDRSSAFIQASYATGDDRNATSVGGGVRIGF